MEVFKGVATKDMLFLDIETVRLKNEFADLNDDFKASFEYKTRYAREATEKFNIEDIEELWREKSPLWSEFAKIVCITLGYISSDDKLKLRSYASHNEKEMLTDFVRDLTLFYNNNPKIKLVGHAVTGFDIPTIMRRCIVNQVEMNPLIDCSNKKPWEVPTIDTLTAWKASGYYSASLINVATALGVPSSKSDIDGSQVSDVYWKDNDLERIVRYCEADVLCTANVARVLRYEPLVEIDGGRVEIEKIPILESIYAKGELSKEDAVELNDFMNDCGFSDKERKMTLDIVMACVKGGRLKKDVKDILNKKLELV